MDDCVFCKIGRGEAPATIHSEFPEAFVMVPLNPVVPGHVLVVPYTHVEDATIDPAITAATMYVASEWAVRHPHCNIITSRGTFASQSVFHLHIHVVPRVRFDGLALPWGTVESGSEDD